MTYADLPGRGERAAPSFDGTATELGRYFSEVEALYDRYNVTDNQERKNGTIKYLATTALEWDWKASDTLTDPTKTYNEFKAEMCAFYPGSSEDVFTVQHLDALVGERARIGIKNMTDLGAYHLRFRTIAKYLISKNRFSVPEQSRTFLRGLGPELEGQVKSRLQIILPRQNPQDPYNLPDMYEAASYILQGNAPAATTNPGYSATNPGIPIKSEFQTEIQSAMRSAVAELGEMFKHVLENQQAANPRPPLPPGRSEAK